MRAREPLTDAQVQAGARPGESWDQARDRLENAAAKKPPGVCQYGDCLNPVTREDDMFTCASCWAQDDPGADYTLAGPVDECEGLDGKPIEWGNGELGVWYY